ncbi:diguanylate cyclase [Sphingomonas sp. M1-B02]|uniref:diguanylate cyclase n=1 Tax=Sphingomonas sp. M1-B02 TaxID=3114300 RepID=UPI002240577A|nr:diguanylate cyclase [Sphingomonas sp. S6-11]UZK64951.1 diguanylate cyclase [Sphingomonas sp. S6-11]
MPVLLSSLSYRVGLLGVFLACSLLALVALLLSNGAQMRSDFAEVDHTQQVIQALDDARTDLSEAESGLRGFLLTRNPAYAGALDSNISGAGARLDQLAELTADNPGQNVRAVRLREAFTQRVETLRAPLELARQKRFDDANALVARGHGLRLTQDFRRRAAEIKQEERRLLELRLAAANGQATKQRLLVSAGGAIIIGILILCITLLIRSVHRPIASMLASMTAFGEGDRTARVDPRTGTQEFDRLAVAYNDMADLVVNAASLREGVSDAELHRANEDLRQQGEVLRARGEVIELLGGMAHRMQAARTDEELAAVIHCFVPRVLPGVPGALYAHNNSRNLLVRLANWGAIGETPETFAPDQCWGLRRGQSHFIDAPGTDVVCAHVGDPAATYHCEPLLAGGEVIGVLHLGGVIEPESRFRLTVLTENIASALLNHSLQRGLREQTIRDPLTALFNRRYMEETLDLEIARASRGGTPLSLVMCDVDHFKRFNDQFGHDAGDAVLRSVAAVMRNHFRDGDVVCRFGGEEFTIIAPGAEPEMVAERVELLREAICAISARHGGQSLGPISMSFGIAAWSNAMRDGSALVQLADAALYQAKNNGRNQVRIADQPGAHLAIAAE